MTHGESFAPRTAMLLRCGITKRRPKQQDAVVEELNRFKKSIEGRYLLLIPGVAILIAF